MLLEIYGFVHGSYCNFMDLFMDLTVILWIFQGCCWKFMDLFNGCYWKCMDVFI